MVPDGSDRSAALDSAEANSGDSTGRGCTMIRYWLGLALLAGSWLFGLKYYHEADGLIFAMMIVAGTLLLCGALQRMPGTAESLIAAVLLVPVTTLAPGPYKAIPILLIISLLLNLAPFPVRWPKALASGAFAAGI